MFEHVSKKDVKETATHISYRSPLNTLVVMVKPEDAVEGRERLEYSLNMFKERRPLLP